MNGWKVVEVDGDREWHKDSRAECEEAIEEFSHMALEIVGPDTATDSSQEPEIVEQADDMVKPEEPNTSESGGDIDERMAEGYQQVNDGKDTVPNIDALAKNPIEWLNSKNSEYVNVIKGKDAISKRGFRYIQSQFGISTESEIIEVLDDPLGVVVWAKAELPNGRKAEAHGEGYQFESGVDDNEFVRYGDTRAKSRALADLTASGALATEEMQGNE